LAGAGLGGTTIDPEDEDMVDAALLAMPDGSGGILWRPSSLQDIYDLPDRVLRLFMQYRAGQSAALANKTPAVASGTIGGVEVT
jgi:hypothetical protein